MTATDVVREKWIASYALNAADTLAHLARVYGDFAVVDGELYAIERRNWWPADYSPTDVDWRLIPPSRETAQ